VKVNIATPRGRYQRLFRIDTGGHGAMEECDVFRGALIIQATDERSIVVTVVMDEDDDEDDDE